MTSKITQDPGFLLLPLLAAFLGCGRKEPTPELLAPTQTSPAPNPPTTSPATNASTGTWTTAYRAGGTDPSGHPLGGTELRSLVPFEGKLYAGLGYWKDTSAQDPKLPGAQILVLDSAKADWRVELELDDVLQNGAQAGERRYQAIGALSTIQFTTNDKGVALAAPKTFLAAGVWSRGLGVEVLVRGAQGWAKTTLGDGHGNVRAFGSYVDATTKVSYAFAGSDRGIFRGTLDSVHGTVAWSTTPEPYAHHGTVDDTPPADWRVMGFVESDHHLYATVGAALFAREDSPSPAWKRVFTATFPPSVDIAGNGGLRGLASIPNPKGSGHVLLVAAGGPTAKMLRLDPSAGFAETSEVDVVALLSKQWGAPVRGALLAYNDMPSVKDSRTGEDALLIGLEVHVPKGTALPFATWNQFRADAALLVRHANGAYDVRVLTDSSLKTQPPRVAVRAMAVSPFDSSTLYASGFDCNDLPAHETAWALEGPIASLFLAH